jgi:hypothetical protein
MNIIRFLYLEFAKRTRFMGLSNTVAGAVAALAFSVREGFSGYWASALTGIFRYYFRYALVFRYGLWGFPNTHGTGLSPPVATIAERTFGSFHRVCGYLLKGVAAIV